LEFEPPDVDRLQASLLRTEEITLRDEIWKYLKRMLASGIRDTDPTSSDKLMNVSSRETITFIEASFRLMKVNYANILLKWSEFVYVPN
jgi:hypothetical protein